MEHKTPREVLGKFYKDNNLDADGGDGSSHVKIEISKHFHFYFPNFNARRKAVVKHDIHHILTGYTTSLSGESEISAWEIASGCKTYWVAFLIDTSGVMLGILFHFFGTLKAFSRGRRTKNLYDDSISNNQTLDLEINELQKKLYLDKYSKDTQPTLSDFVWFTLFAVFGLLYSIFILPLLPFIIIYTIYIELKFKFN